MIRFAIKAGLAGSAVYYLNEEGVWRHSSESLKVYNKLSTNLEPYIDEAKKQIPIQLPEIPKTERLSHSAANYWNLGVTKSFKFLSELPHHSCELVESGIDNIRQHPEYKKLFAAKPPQETIKKQ